MGRPPTRGATAATVAAALGMPLARWEMTGSGQGTTAFGCTSDSRTVVVKWSCEPGAAEGAEQAICIAEILRGRGWPAPATLAHGPVAEVGYGWLQERLAGAPIRSWDEGLLEQVVSVIELQAEVEFGHGVAGPHTWVAGVLDEDRAGWWRAAADFSASTASAAAALRAWLAEAPGKARGGDYVHLDLNFSNVLVSGGRVTGVVDLDYLTSGDRAADLASLALDHAGLVVERGGAKLPEGFFRLRQAARDISGEAGWRRGLAHGALSWLGWSNARGWRIDPAKAVATTELVLRADPSRDRMRTT